MDVFNTTAGMKAEALFVHWAPGPGWGSFDRFSFPFFLFLNKNYPRGDRCYLRSAAE